MRRALAPLLVACLALAACGGSEENPALLRGSDADALAERLDRIRNAVSDGRCTDADGAIAKLQAQIAALPESTSSRLRDELAEGAQALDRDAPAECEARDTPTTTTETTPPETAPPETVPPETTPTETAPPETVPTVPDEVPTIPETPTLPDEVPLPEGGGELAPGSGE